MAMAWKVVSQVVTQKPNANGDYVPGVDVTYETGDGIKDSVFFPMPEYTVDNVRQTLGDRVAVHDGVAGLGG